METVKQGESLWLSFRDEIINELIESNIKNPFVFVHCKEETVFDCCVVSCHELSIEWQNVVKISDGIGAIAFVFIFHGENNSSRLWVKHVDKAIIERCLTLSH